MDARKIFMIVVAMIMIAMPVMAFNFNTDLQLYLIVNETEIGQTALPGDDHNDWMSLYDMSGNNNHATANGTIPFVNSSGVAHFVFTEQNAFMVMESNKLDLQTINEGEFVGLWFQTKDNDSLTSLIEFNGLGDDLYKLVWDARSPQRRMRATFDETSCPLTRPAFSLDGNITLNDGNWHLVGLYINNTVGAIFVDGRLYNKSDASSCDRINPINQDMYINLDKQLTDINGLGYSIDMNVSSVYIINKSVTESTLNDLYLKGAGYRPLNNRTASPFDISNCSHDLSTPGTYTLTGNIDYDITTNCLIAYDDVTIDCKGNRIRRLSDFNPGTAILVNGSGVTITNCTFENNTYTARTEGIRNGFHAYDLNIIKSWGYTFYIQGNDTLIEDSSISGHTSSYLAYIDGFNNSLSDLAFSGGTNDWSLKIYGGYSVDNVSIDSPRNLDTKVYAPSNITSSSFTGGTRGLSLGETYGNLTITDSTFYDHSVYSIVTFNHRGGYLSITNNTFRNDTSQAFLFYGLGSYTTNSTIEITNNSIHDNAIAMTFNGDGVNSSFIITNNNIYNNSDVFNRVNDAPKLNISGNYYADGALVPGTALCQVGFIDDGIEDNLTYCIKSGWLYVPQNIPIMGNITYPASDGQVFKGNLTLSWNTASDADGNFDHYEVYVFNSTGHKIISDDNVSGTSFLIDTTAYNDDLLVFYVWAVDETGLNDSQSRTFYIDNTAPLLSITYPTGEYGKGAVNLSFEDNHPDLIVSDVSAFSLDGSVSFPSVSFTYTDSVSFAGNVTFTAYDVVNNTAMITKYVIFDVVLPSCTGITSKNLEINKSYNWVVDCVDDLGLQSLNISCSGGSSVSYFYDNLSNTNLSFVNSTGALETETECIFIVIDDANNTRQYIQRFAIEEKRVFFDFDLTQLENVLILAVLVFAWLGMLVIGTAFRNFGFATFGFFIGIFIAFILSNVHIWLGLVFIFMNIGVWMGSAKTIGK